MKQNTSGYLLALLAVVIWSGNFVVARAVADAVIAAARASGVARA